VTEWAHYFGIRDTGVDVSGREDFLRRLETYVLAGQAEIITQGYRI
jgi:hypothetical protein